MNGFCPKLLAVRPVRHARNVSASLFRLHIYFLATVLGLSLPYRIWFSKHCDEIRVTVVKETSDSTTAHTQEEEEAINEAKSSSWLKSKLGWGASSTSAATERQRAQELFRKNMQSFSLYEEEPLPLDGNTGEQLEPSSSLLPVSNNSLTDDRQDVSFPASENDDVQIKSVDNLQYEDEKKTTVFDSKTTTLTINDNFSSVVKKITPMPDSKLLSITADSSDLTSESIPPPPPLPPLPPP